jgi:hypothetical protein
MMPCGRSSSLMRMRKLVSDQQIETRAVEVSCLIRESLREVAKGRNVKWRSL